MNELLSRYLTHLRGERNLSPYTVRNYRTDIQQFTDFLRDQHLSSLENADRITVRRYLAWLDGERYGRKSIARKIAEVRSFYRFLVREKVLPTNPLAHLSAPKVERRLPSFLGQSEVEGLVEAPATATPLGQRDRAITELLYAAGLRVSELVGLDNMDVSLDRGEVRVMGKGSKERIALMGVPARQALVSYVENARPKLARNTSGSALFLNRFGGRLSQRSVQNMVTKYSRQAGLTKRVTPHVVRHTFATHLLDGGADLRVVQELLGHERLATTQGYMHVTKAHARRVYMDHHPRAKAGEKGGNSEDHSSPRAQP
ncbi:MAG: tyrosine recombinase XerC [Chloroflexi bacterium]|nr:tyrosine recombinase XerC [Chloroflexota bacterium]